MPNLIGVCDIIAVFVTVSPTTKSDQEKAVDSMRALHTERLLRG